MIKKTIFQVDRDDYDHLGKLLMETLSLSGICMDMKYGRERDDGLFLRWEHVDEESKAIYRTASRELLKIFCRVFDVSIEETGKIDDPVWREFFKLMKTQPKSSEPNVIFNALLSGRLPEA